MKKSYLTKEDSKFIDKQLNIIYDDIPMVGGRQTQRAATRIFRFIEKITEKEGEL